MKGGGRTACTAEGPYEGVGPPATYFAPLPYPALQVLDPQLHACLQQRDCLNYFFCFRWLLIHFKVQGRQGRLFSSLVAWL